METHSNSIAVPLYQLCITVPVQEYRYYSTSVAVLNIL